MRWYESPVRQAGAPRGNAPKREGNAKCAQYDSLRYPIKKSSVLSKEATDIIRKGALRENCVYYFRHAQIASAIRDGNFVWGADRDLDAHTSSSSAPDCGEDYAHRHTELRYPHLPPRVRPIAPSRTFKTGTANVEAFPRELLCEMPKGIPGLELLRKLSAFGRLLSSLGALSSYAGYAPIICARGRKMEFLIGL